jgi:DNA invertase Pin-like site-specific DNA recombinase
VTWRNGGIIRARTRAALQAKKARGERVGTVCFGFRVGDDGATLEKEPDEQRIIRRVKGLRNQGQSIRAIVALLEAEGMLSRTRKPISKGTVESILRRTASEGSPV